MLKQCLLKASVSYEAPELKVLKISVENGFADSGIENAGFPAWEMDGSEETVTAVPM